MKEKKGERVKWEKVKNTIKIKAYQRKNKSQNLSNNTNKI